MEPELSSQEKALRDSFVIEYLKDFDPYAACLRVGFQSAFAVEFSKKLIHESYVQKRIAELQRVQPSNKEVQDKEDEALVRNVLRQASQNGPYASRVAAAAKLANILGIDKPESTDDNEKALIDAFKEFAARAPV